LQARLKGTVSSDKNEILFSQFDVNYNNEPEQFRKGTVLWKKPVEIPLPELNEELKELQGRRKYQLAKSKTRIQIQEASCDIIGDTFWTENPHLLEPYRNL
jgi:tRNA(His) guanylyltransferase